MARPPGSRNADYEQKRLALAEKVVWRVMQIGGHRASMRELAQAAQVSVPTLRHYFTDREGVVAAALATMKDIGKHHLDRAADHHVDQPMEASLRWAVGEFATGWIRGVGQLVTAGIVLGVNNDTLGPAFVDATLEPTLQSFERRLGHHQRAGELDPSADLRAASLALVCPVILGLLHQVQLRGSTCRHLNLETFLDDHVTRFVRGWGA